MVKPRIVLLIFVSGKVVLTGKKSYLCRSMIFKGELRFTMYIYYATSTVLPLTELLVMSKVHF